MGGVFMGGDGYLLAAESIAVLSITSWSCLLGVLIFLPLHHYGLMRIPDEFELTGIDVSIFGRPAYNSGERGVMIHNAITRTLSPPESINSTDAPPAVVTGTPLAEALGPYDVTVRPSMTE